MGYWKYGSGEVNKPFARWLNVFLIISLLITFNGYPSVWFLLSLLTTPFLVLYCPITLPCGFPLIFNSFLIFIYKLIKKSGFPKLLESYLALIDRQGKKIIKRFKK
tara:strand:- start:47 stop:364 length:318 start_codon:yes stop_codon:yes gene_type:complete